MLTMPMQQARPTHGATYHKCRSIAIKASLKTTCVEDGPCLSGARSGDHNGTASTHLGIGPRRPISQSCLNSTTWKVAHKPVHSRPILCPSRHYHQQ